MVLVGLDGQILIKELVELEANDVLTPPWGGILSTPWLFMALVSSLDPSPCFLAPYRLLSGARRCLCKVMKICTWIHSECSPCLTNTNLLLFIFRECFLTFSGITVAKSFHYFTEFSTQPFLPLMIRLWRLFGNSELCCLTSSVTSWLCPHISSYALHLFVSKLVSFLFKAVCMLSCSIMSDSLRLHGL